MVKRLKFYKEIKNIFTFNFILYKTYISIMLTFIIRM